MHEVTCLHFLTVVLIKICSHLLQTLFMYYVWRYTNLPLLLLACHYSRSYRGSFPNSKMCYCILEVPFPSHGRDTECTAVHRVFTQFIQANICILFQIRPWLFPCTIFPIFDPLFPNYFTSRTVKWTTDTYRTLWNTKHF